MRKIKELITMKINKIEDLNELKEAYRSGTIKLNISSIARQMGVDRRTVKSYLLRENDEHSNTRKKPSIFDKELDFILGLLNNKEKRFTTVKSLYNYMLKANKIGNASYSAFTYYVRNNKLLQEKFKNNNINISTIIETDYGEEAQLDWKEDVKIVLDTGEIVFINILVLILSKSRYRVARISTSKSQSVLFHMLISMFKELGGVPKIIRTDNMKTVMDEPKTEYSSGKINDKFNQFAKDCGFETRACKAFVPKRKGKVEQPNRVYDEIMAWNGEKSLIGFNDLVKEIAKNENKRYHKDYNKVPTIEFVTEKKFLKPLPNEDIRNYYTIKTEKRIVSNRSLIAYDNKYYSVPAYYIGQIVYVRCFDNLIHIYSTTPEFKLLSIHTKLDKNSQRNISYTKDDYKSIYDVGYKNLSDDLVDKFVDNYFNELTKITGENESDD